jgi:hypothetical protein
MQRHANSLSRAQEFDSSLQINEATDEMETLLFEELTRVGYRY